ncbi:MAG: hypothetical protein HY785_26195 [Oscillatoriophycideae cyanobacterium NC_groundwater_1537_Pr4_S-0.65um_50_18]|nr:hypothetical protein [Oscillatoriophycideae cyanobacterium NC_groundwater_1537_Pr4_S-0.65um_50_18]
MMNSVKLKSAYCLNEVQIKISLQNERSVKVTKGDLKAYSTCAAIFYSGLLRVAEFKDELPFKASILVASGFKVS